MDAVANFRDIFVLQNHITWVKSVSIGDDRVGHFKLITREQYLNNNHEAVLHFTKSARSSLTVWRSAFPSRTRRISCAGASSATGAVLATYDSSHIRP